jgi:ParB-like chromosome segregation protein Spo0J
MLAKSATDAEFGFAEADRLLAPAAPKFHPITEIIPMLDDDVHALAYSIRAIGQIVPIVIDEKTNMIVDGRCRWRACEIVGVEPKIERREFADDRDILDFIISMNVHRSHKTEDQRAMAAARLLESLPSGRR